MLELNLMQKPKTNLNHFSLKKQEGKIVAVFILSLLLYLVFILFSDIHKVQKITAQFNWKVLPFLLFLVLCNYFFRALRFHLYLRELKIFIPLKESISVFLSGLSMTVTPGKSGEIIKAYLLKKTHNVPVSEVLPLLIIERMTDGISMILLGIGGIFILQKSIIFFIASALFVALFILFLKSKKIILPILHKLEKKFPNFKLLKFFDIFFENSKTLVSAKNLTMGIVLGCIAWFFEGFVLYYIISNFIHLNFFSGISTALFIFSFSSIAGFFVLIPGGIGVAEGSITYFITTFFALSTAPAVFITLFFRFISLWFGVSIGLIALMHNLRKNHLSDDLNVSQ
jgi:uncharacterized protein (TIRG00374 family)